ncbi:MAG TPA: hypothetical protein VGC84_02900 [Ilumatobacteraceae bacterium]
MAEYDNDPVAALSSALRIVLDMPNATWDELLAAAPIESQQRRRLASSDLTTLDRLAADLNEFRSFR